MASRSGVNAGGISFMGMLLILFIGLKLTGFISWSWWWVFAPLWGPPAIVAGGLLAVLVIAIMVSCAAALMVGDD